MTMQMNEFDEKQKYDFLPIGKAIKKARESRKL